MTEVLSVKVDEEKFRELEQIAREEHSDRSTVARRLLDIGMKDWKLNKGVDMFRQGKVSLWKGASIAGVSLREFVEILNEKKIDWVGISPEEVEAEVRAIKKRSR